MVFLRDVSKKQIMDAYREGFRANSAGPKLDALLAKLKRIEPAIPIMREAAAEMFVTYVPGKGTTVSAAGGAARDGGGEGLRRRDVPELARAEPADDDLKKALLGR